MEVITLRDPYGEEVDVPCELLQDVAQLNTRQLAEMLTRQVQLNTVTHEMVTMVTHVVNERASYDDAYAWLASQACLAAWRRLEATQSRY